ncbi:MAG: hypothetical protein IPI18_18335 [Saprospiraceae bacterium]|nr:hypothetical protein [Saprospiraceae bacterium]
MVPHPQPGWFTAPKVGVVGVVGAEFTVALGEVPEVHDLMWLLLHSCQLVQ